MITPAQSFDFTSAALDSKISFSRVGNTATRINASGVLEASAANTARFDFNPVTLVCRGLLIEGTSTNLFADSENFAAATWTPSNTSVSSDIVNGPNNSMVGDRLTVTAVNTVQGIYPTSFFVASGGIYGFSIFIRKDTTAKDVYLQFRPTISSGALYGQIVVNTVNGFVSANAGSATSFTYSIDLVNGWWRCSMSSSGIPAATNMRAVVRLISQPIGTTLELFGAQLEAGPVSSYVPTSGVAETRNPDIATITGTNFSDFWQASKGGAQVQAIPSTISGIRPLVQYDDGTADNIIALRGNTANLELQIVDGGAPQVQLDAGTIVANTPYSLTGWWQENNSFAQLNTQASVRDGTVTIPTVTQAKIGSDGTNYLNGHIATIDYYNELSNSIYDSLRLLGYTGTVTDMLLQYYLARGATSNSLTDAELEFLTAKGFTTGTVDDRWVNYLNSLGYVGTITDMKYQYWKSPE